MTEEDTIKGVFYGAPSSVYSKYSPMSEFEQCKEYMVAVNSVSLSQISLVHLWFQQQLDGELFCAGQANLELTAWSSGRVSLCLWPLFPKAMGAYAA